MKKDNIYSSLLPYEEMVEAVCSDNVFLILGGMVDLNTELCTFIVHNNIKVIQVPFSFFTPSCSGTCCPEFEKIKIIDWGHSVQFGLYEASSRHIIESFS